MKDIINVIIDELKSEESIKLGVDIAEVGMDKFLDNSFLQTVPFLNTIYSIYKGALNISDRLLLLKVTKFLHPLKNSDIPLGNRIKFLDKMNTSQSYRNKVSYDLLNILDKMDEIDKVDLIAKAFHCYLLDIITYSEFTRCAYGINTAFIKDLQALVRMEEDKELFNERKMNLIHTGFVRFVISGKYNQIGKIYYEVTELGIKLIQIAKLE